MSRDNVSKISFAKSGKDGEISPRMILLDVLGSADEFSEIVIIATKKVPKEVSGEEGTVETVCSWSSQTLSDVLFASKMLEADVMEQIRS